MVAARGGRHGRAWHGRAWHGCAWHGQGARGSLEERHTEKECRRRGDAAATGWYGVANGSSELPLSRKMARPQVATNPPQLAPGGAESSLDSCHQDTRHDPTNTLARARARATTGPPDSTRAAATHWRRHAGRGVGSCLGEDSGLCV